MMKGKSTLIPNVHKRKKMDQSKHKDFQRDNPKGYTVSIETMMLSCTIYAKENRYIVVSDIPGTFLLANMDDHIHMLLEGKALHGTLQAAILFWKL